MDSQLYVGASTNKRVQKFVIRYQSCFPVFFVNATLFNALMISSPEQRETLLKQLQVNAEDMEVQFICELVYFFFIKISHGVIQLHEKTILSCKFT